MACLCQEYKDSSQVIDDMITSAVRDVSKYKRERRLLIADRTVDCRPLETEKKDRMYGHLGYHCRTVAGIMQPQQLRMLRAAIGIEVLSTSTVQLKRYTVPY